MKCTVRCGELRQNGAYFSELVSEVKKRNLETFKPKNRN